MLYDNALRSLRALARAYGVQTSYENNDQEIVWAPPSTLAALVNALAGREMLDPQQIDPDAVRAELSGLRRRKLEACLPEISVAFDGKLAACRAWIEQEKFSHALEIIVKLETGEVLREQAAEKELSCARRHFVGSGTYVRAGLGFRQKIPYGYHTLEVHSQGVKLGESFLISAPRELPQGRRGWGGFAPAYAIRSQHDWGIGGLRELGEVCRFVGETGGHFVGTLPMLAARMEGPDPGISPYSPSSRLFWNEIYLDIENLPGYAADISEADRTEIRKLRDEDHIDYQGVYALKKKHILRAAAQFFSSGGAERDAFKKFGEEYPKARDYAEFRAAQAAPEDRESMRDYHWYAQFSMHCQLLALGETARTEQAAELYLDYPVGVENDGFDAREFDRLFISGFNVGAPPDAFSSSGQDWSFRPLNPRRMAEDRFNYFRDSLHNYFRYARMIRFDHIMGLYRIFCVPADQSPSQGAYVQYPFEARIAVLSLECYRHNGIIIGEDLGTVPRIVREAMKEHGMARMWLFQFYFKPDPDKTFAAIPERALAALNTHDMFPFSAFLEGEDIETLHSVGAFDREQCDRLQEDRNTKLARWRDHKNPFAFVIRNLAASPARFLLINFEDLWGETRPQNVPGTTWQYPNWRKKFTRTFEAWSQDRQILKTLDHINHDREARK